MQTWSIQNTIMNFTFIETWRNCNVTFWILFTQICLVWKFPHISSTNSTSKQNIFFLKKKKNNLKFCKLFWSLLTILTLNITVGWWCYSILPAKVGEGIMVLPEASKKWLTDICVISLVPCEMLAIAINTVVISLYWNGQLPLFVTIKT